MSFESPIAPEAALPTPREFRAQRASFVFLAYVGIQFFAGFFIGIAAAIWYLATHRHGAPSVPEAILRSATMWGATIGMVASGATAYWLTRQLVGRAHQGHPLEPFGWSNSTLRPMLIAALAGRSLIPPILVHTGYNAVIVAATLASYA